MEREVKLKRPPSQQTLGKVSPEAKTPHRPHLLVPCPPAPRTRGPAPSTQAPPPLLSLADQSYIQASPPAFNCDISSSSLTTSGKGPLLMSAPS